ncbi:MULTISPECIES: AarF/ABC1/UbiB kinase family protein [unclassified Thermosynechococcus]|uniref:ABC1 kinase family protein n=1 Tax=unclassified Thermosynechococcus TaxID=2622553 RepID=UPI0019805FC8|nr:MULTISPECIES: AarF/ABC1/UbiB kinase family protein [unclassified Thermosynechococcus]MDR5638791.1 AarF/ABC1/UbiB kinase family protein [Thermosynechococcus sp. PP42]MDR7922791.1 AarF/ABC1/UbiB kinase family protein [Thermosynechococcus sp. HY213]QSF48631.1 AarF/ABC1/UbiB kinase family protein [Thermosynechococcus sp. TA-1]WKT80608.1 AarF/ABC1/UbiB kinase family protein [Thermosynechococcus sp. PP45]WNC21674.1 AarF/ABC1/UbiB kinase family protein [Thermosynechococcus sp. PP22]
MTARISAVPSAGHRRYDPEAIARYYWRHPWRVIWRFLNIAVSFLTFWLLLQWDKWLGQQESQRPLRAMQLRKLLIRLGPTFIKVGQALSTRPDLICPDYLEELTLLQDKLPPFANEIAIAIIERDLRLNLGDIFAEFSPQPVAAASLGQVYRAKLHSGEEVAVKVQRPNLLPVITRDLFLIRLLVQWVKPWLPINLCHDLRDIVDEFGRKLYEEIDYLNEGRNAEKFAANFHDDPTVKVPKIYWEYTTEHVLTLEWIHGIKLTRTDCMVAAGVNPDELIRVGVISGLRQLLEFGFFHADPHPGNLFAMPDGRMAYIDFGMMDQLEESTKESLVDAVVHLVNKDYQALATDFVKLGFLTPETDITPIIPALESVFEEVIGSSVREFNFKVITDRFSELMYAYPFRVPAKFALIIRSLVTQEGIALCLNPNFRIVDVSYPYVARRLLQGESPQLRRRLLDVLFKDGRLQWQRLENLIAIARQDQHFNLAPTATLGLQYLFSEEGQYLRRQIVLALTEDDRLHTEEVQRLWNLVKSDLRPLFLIDVAWEALKASVSHTLGKEEDSNSLVVAS